MNFFIAGFMGSGKTTIGTLLAKKLNLPFTDTDNIIESIAKKTISEIFSQDGEKTFREIEHLAILKACEDKNNVVALGGGALENIENRKIIKENGIVICLDIDAKTSVKRAKDRPLLQVKNPLERAKNLLKKRKKNYLESADLIFSSHNYPLAIIDEILAELYPSICGTAIKKISSKNLDCDLVEYRIDLMENPNIEELVNKCSIPCIITDRKKVESYIEAAHAGCNYIDIDITVPSLASIIESVKEISPDTKIICSAHFFDTFPSQETLQETYNSVKEYGEIGKIITTANTKEEMHLTLDLLKKAKKDNFQLILFTMGPFADMSRILAPLKGSFLTYGYIHQAVAQNQPSVNQLSERFRKLGVRS